MFQLYSKSCEYALKALMQFPPKNDETKLSLRGICQQANIPEAYTRKVFQALVQAGFLRAVTGPSGGYQLSGSPQTISLLDIIHAVEGPKVFDRCLMGAVSCRSKNKCPVHETWLAVRGSLLDALEKKTLAELIEGKT